MGQTPSRRGTRTSSVVPLLGAESTVRCPPAIAARSRMLINPKWRWPVRLSQVIGSKPRPLSRMAMRSTLFSAVT